VNVSLRAIACSLLFGVRSAFCIIGLKEALVPDTQLLASGRAWWSSPALGLAGYVGGIWAVRIVAILSSLALGYYLGMQTTITRTLAVFALPPGWYTIQAGSDSAGAAALLATKKKSSFVAVLVTSLFHLEAGLVILFARVFSCYKARRYWGLVAGILAMIAQRHVQVRYLLPGLCLYVTSAEMHPKERETLQNPSRRFYAMGDKNGRAKSVAQDCTTSNPQACEMECNLARHQQSEKIMKPDLFFAVYLSIIFFVCVLIVTYIAPVVF
jgi:hypothetical protein